MNSCPLHEQLVKLLNEQLDEPESARLEKHIESCLRCQETLADLSQKMEGVDFAAIRDIPRDPTDADTLAFLERVKKRQNEFTQQATSSLGVSEIYDRPLVSRELPVVEGYELLAEIGRGGMGIVYKARHLDLNRLVALKMLPASHFVSTDSRHRFRREAKAIGRLHHANIVQIYDIGETSSGPFLSLELVSTGSLAQRFNGSPWKPFDAARFVERIAEAIHYAHSQGVIHRDLKPANVLVSIEDSKSETTSPILIPKITDFGLAKCADESLGQTPNGTVLGTPSYLAPEQIMRNSEPLGPATDVYGLGAILYELITGVPPFRGDSVISTLLQVTHQEAIAPSRLGIKVPRDLETICLKCLEKSPTNRYSTAAQLAEDLRRVVAGESIIARPPKTAERTLRWVKRHPAAALLLVGFFAATLIGIGTALWVQTERLSLAKAQDRRTLKAGQEVNLILEETITLYGKAQGADRNLGFWADAMASIAKAEKIAGDASAGIRNRVEELRAEIVQHEKNHRLITTLAEIQASMGDNLLDTGDQDFPTADAAYAQAFHDFSGTQFDETNAELNAKRLGSLGADVLVDMAAAIDNWRYVRFVLKTQNSKYSNDANHLHALSRLLDPDPIRNQIRDAIDKRDRKQLLALASQINPAAQPVQTINLIAVYLYWIREKKDYSDEISFLQSAQLHHSRDFQINHNLAFCLIQADRPDEAEPYTIAETIIRPTSAAAWQDRANVLRRCGRDTEAIAAYRRTAALAPRSIFYLKWAGYFLDLQDKKEEAIAVYREAARRIAQYNPRYAGLTDSWKKYGLVDEVIAEYRKVLESAPDDRPTREGLCSLYFNVGSWPEYLSESRFLESVNRNNASYYFNLGVALHNNGEYASAVNTFNQSLAIDPKFTRPQKSLDDASRLLSLEERFPRMLAEDSATNAERLELANAFLYWNRRYFDAVALYRIVFAGDPSLAERLDLFHCYNAGCSATLASTGAGVGADQLDEKTRTELLQQALDWLNANLVAHERQIAEHPTLALQLEVEIEHWKRDPDLVGLRDQKALESLTAAQRDQCTQFWDSVERLKLKAVESYAKSELKDFLNRNNRQRIHWLKVSKGSTFVIEMKSPDLKSCLQVENYQDEIIAQNNQNGSQQNSRLEFVAPTEGAYRILATSFNQTGSGAYVITVCEFPTIKK